MITIKEEFLTDAKTLRAIKLGGHAAITLWLAMKGHAASRLTDGFVSDEDIETLPGAPSRPRKALKALVDCGVANRDGTRGAGLVDKVDGGWQLHDYLDHATSREEVELRREKDREKKRRQREQARVELERLRLRNSGESPGDSTGDKPRDTGGGRAKDPRARAYDPQPSPAQPMDPKAVEVDPNLSGSARNLAAAAAAPTNLKEALKVPPTDRAKLLERDPHMADWLEPQSWPEVLAVAKAWGEARLGAYKRDSGVRAVVGCLADGFTQNELLGAIPRIRGSDWGKQRKLGMASMTPEVIRRALDGTEPVKQPDRRPKAPNEDFDARQREREADAMTKLMHEVKELERGSVRTGPR